MDKLKDLLKAAHSRRSFLAGVGVAGATAMLVGCGDDSRTTPTTPTNPTPTPATDADILNFALNLEYLEAEYYLRATTGQGLSSTDAGSGAGAVTGGAMVTFPNAVLSQYAFEIAQDELNHVRFLRQALGSAAVSRPAIDLTNSFNGLAMAAGIGSTFNPFADSNSFLLGAFVFEDVGVTAYHGAAGLLTDKTNLGAAAGIMAVEAYHAAEIRTLIYGESVAMSSTALVDTANKVSTLRGTLGGGNETALSATTIVAADSMNAIAFDRTTNQVLHIVYAAGAGVATKGGFFPNGLNGKITATTA
ncbi:MAG TPA: ferritin-like domain-containing protein [Terriglobales bacterium]|nr:ferritin-like domain-containing protein [Terriglobales bacterium]